MSNYEPRIESNNLDLTSILSTINELPEAAPPEPELDIPEKGTPLSEWTWQQVIDLCNSELDVEEYFAIGDEKNVVLTTGETVPFVIGDFYHNPITGTRRNAAIAFTSKNCLNTTYAINDTQTNAGGWDGSKMRNTHMVNILNTFPAELRAEKAIKTVKVAASAGGKSTSLIISSDKLRLHSVTELGLVNSIAAIEGTVYPYYASGNRTKTINGASGTYWTRTPALDGTNTFCYVYPPSAVYSSYTDNSSRGVPICFDI